MIEIANMGSTYLSLHFHIVFATKDRQPTIDSKWMGRLHEYMGGIIRKLEGVPEAIGGIEDHVHLLVGLRATHVLADLVRELKKSATHWIRESSDQKQFMWQEGYAAFTVSPTARRSVADYICRQAEPHRKVNSQMELENMLRRAGLEFDPRYFE